MLWTRKNFENEKNFEKKFEKKNINKRATQRVLEPALLKPGNTTPLPTAPRMLAKRIASKIVFNLNPNQVLWRIWNSPNLRTLRWTRPRPPYGCRFNAVTFDLAAIFEFVFCTTWAPPDGCLEDDWDAMYVFRCICSSVVHLLV